MVRGIAAFGFAVVLVAAAGSAGAQQRTASTRAEQNVRESQQYEQLTCSNAAFRAKRIAQECGPLQGRELHDELRRLVQLRRRAAERRALAQRTALADDPLKAGQIGPRRTIRWQQIRLPAGPRSPSTASISIPRASGCASPLAARSIADSTDARPRRGDRPWPGLLHPGKGHAARSDATDRAQHLLPVQGRRLVLDDGGRQGRRGEELGERGLGLRDAV